MAHPITTLVGNASVTVEEWEPFKTQTETNYILVIRPLHTIASTVIDIDPLTAKDLITRLGLKLQPKPSGAYRYVEYK